ncbi:MAG: hypothetical protein KGH66_03575 [Candidatus Micrarchaeota archaeon]|nr:hypothetical protein [Candidatus Micrarchaeota archaeon]
MILATKQYETRLLSRYDTIRYKGNDFSFDPRCGLTKTDIANISRKCEVGETAENVKTAHGAVNCRLFFKCRDLEIETLLEGRSRKAALNNPFTYPYGILQQFAVMERMHRVLPANTPAAESIVFLNRKPAGHLSTLIVGRSITELYNQFILKRRGLTESLENSIREQLTTCIRVLHKHGIVHGDMQNTDNLIMERHGVLQLIDPDSPILRGRWDTKCLSMSKLFRMAADRDDMAVSHILDNNLSNFRRWRSMRPEDSLVTE